MPSIDYVLKGYDVFYGNPMNTNAKPDPGFRDKIFKAIYTTGSDSVC